MVTLKDIGVGLVYCPREGINLEDSIAWIKDGGFSDNLYVSDAYQLGIVGNWLNCCQHLVRSSYQWLIPFENDVELCLGAKDILLEFLSEVDPEQTAFISLYTPNGYINSFDVLLEGWRHIVRGWGNWAGQALCMHISVLQKILTLPLWPSLAKRNLEKNGGGGGADSLVGVFAKQHNLATYFHYPSLTNHVGVSARVPLPKIPHFGLNYKRDYDLKSRRRLRIY